MPSILAPKVKHQDKMCPHLFDLWNQLGPQPRKLHRNLTINFQIRGCYLIQKIRKLSSKVNVRCHQNLITPDTHYSTYSYWVTSVSDNSRFSVIAWTDRKDWSHYAASLVCQVIIQTFTRHWNDGIMKKPCLSSLFLSFQSSMIYNICASCSMFSYSKSIYFWIIDWARMNTYVHVMDVQFLCRANSV